MKLPEYHELVLEIDRFQRSIENKKRVFQHYDDKVLNASFDNCISVFPKPLNKIMESIYTNANVDTMHRIEKVIHFLQLVKKLGKDEYTSRRQRLDDFLPKMLGTSYDPIVGEEREEARKKMINILSTPNETVRSDELRAIDAWTKQHGRDLSNRL